MFRWMRPARFAALLQQLIRDDPQDTGAWPLPDSGYTSCPYGVTLGLPTGTLVHCQCAGSYPPGSEPGDPEPVVQGTPPPPMSTPDLPTGGLTQAVNVERYLGGLLTGAQPSELASVRLYADREKPGAVPHGLTAHFHSGARAFLYVRHAVPPGATISSHDKPFRPVPVF